MGKNQRHVYDLIVKRSGTPASKGLSNFVYANCFCPDRDTDNALNKNKDKFDVIIVGLYDKGLVRPETKYDKFDRPYLVWYAALQQELQQECISDYATVH